MVAVHGRLDFRASSHGNDRRLGKGRRRGPVDDDELDRPVELVRNHRSAFETKRGSSCQPDTNLDSFLVDPGDLTALEESSLRDRNDYNCYTSSSDQSFVDNDAAVAVALQLQLYREMHEQETENLQKSLTLALFRS